MKMPSAHKLPDDLQEYLLKHSLESIVAQYPQAKNAKFKDCNFLLDDSNMWHVLVSYWTLKDHPNIGDQTEYCFNLNISPQFLKEAKLLTPEEKIKLMQFSELSEITMLNPFDGDPMFQE